jgi:hypothetical protein
LIFMPMAPNKYNPLDPNAAAVHFQQSRGDTASCCDNFQQVGREYGGIKVQLVQV